MRPSQALGIREDFIDVVGLREDLPYELLFNIFANGILIMGDEKLYQDLKHRVILKYFSEFFNCFNSISYILFTCSLSKVSISNLSEDY